MSKYFLDIGWKSIRHAGEELCGDHVDVIDDRNGNMTAVIADGLGSGVRASILSTLTSKIISTMIAEGLPLMRQYNCFYASCYERSQCCVFYIYNSACQRWKRNASYSV